MVDRATYQEIVDNAVEATGAHYVQINRYDPVSREVRLIAWSGAQHGWTRRGLETIRRVLPGFEPLDVTLDVDVNECNRQIYLEGRVVSATLAEVAAGVVDDRLIRIAATIAGMEHAFVCPLRVSGEVVGALAFFTPQPLTTSQRHTAEAFARQVALTLENEKLLEVLHHQVEELQRSRQRITAAEERLRREIAEVLHGRIQTRLLVAWYQLGNCENLLDTDPDRARSLLLDVRNEIDRIREQEVREISHTLHPSFIRIGLVPAVRSLATRFEGAFEFTLDVDPAVSHLDDPAENKIPEHLRLTAYRVIEETLTNTYRHAKANQVEVSIALDNHGRLSVTITDDGQGFDAKTVRAGLGLSTIAGRVDQVGGTWQIVSTPGQGTWTFVRLQLTSPEGDLLAPMSDWAAGRE